MVPDASNRPQYVARNRVIIRLLYWMVVKELQPLACALAPKTRPRCRTLLRTTYQASALQATLMQNSWPTALKPEPQLDEAALVPQSEEGWQSSAPASKLITMLAHEWVPHLGSRQASLFLTMVRPSGQMAHANVP